MSCSVLTYLLLWTHKHTSSMLHIDCYTAQRNDLNVLALPLMFNLGTTVGMLDGSWTLLTCRILCYLGPFVYLMCQLAALCCCFFHDSFIPQLWSDFHNIHQYKYNLQWNVFLLFCYDRPLNCNYFIQISQQGWTTPIMNLIDLQRRVVEGRRHVESLQMKSLLLCGEHNSQHSWAASGRQKLFYLHHTLFSYTLWKKQQYLSFMMQENSLKDD